MSVVVATYNHEQFIAQALDSVLAQQTDRPIELIISEDRSTDGTTAIVADYARTDPRVRLMLSSRNLRSNEVIARGIRAAKGRYICLLDGDDYWVSPAKLERQAAVLDAHRDISACFHNAVVVRDDGPTAERWTPATQARRVTADDIWHGNPFATCAGMMRASALHDLGDWYDELFPITDWPLYVLCSEHGDLLFEDEVVGGYRLHDDGLFSAQPSRAKLELTARFYRLMDAALGGRAHDRARAGASRYFFEWAKVHAAEGDRAMGRHCLQLCRRAGGVGLSVGRREWARCAWHLWWRP